MDKGGIAPKSTSESTSTLYKSCRWCCWHVLALVGFQQLRGVRLGKSLVIDGSMHDSLILFRKLMGVTSNVTIRY